MRNPAIPGPGGLLSRERSTEAGEETSGHVLVRTGEEPPLQQKRRRRKRRGLHVALAESWAEVPGSSGPIPA